MEDKVVFDQSFHSYGKSFPRIHQQVIKQYIRFL